MPVKTAVAAAISAPLLAVATLAAIAGAVGADSDSTTSSICSTGATGPADTKNLTTAQLANAKIIADVGVSMGVPMPGETIAIATALQESGLQNLDYGDRDSLGLFQQRPSQGWGTAAEIMNPTYAAQQFYKQLLQVPGWRSMSTTAAAQAVQHSAFPDAYEKWSAEASALATEFTGNAATCTPTDSGDNTVAAAAVNAAGYSIPAGTPAPIAAVITFALAQLGKPYVYGATGPNAYDCSGLIQAAYARIGVELPRTTFEQVKVGSPIYNVSQLQPGDLLFIPGSDGTASAPGHVGMYLGDNLLIQAPETGQRVKISPINQWLNSIVAMRHVT
ncbi:C40 family peptidase [Actinospica sp. MGRD01-02]|uniref:C40 family peptidase n=1 Tax=Actinospica acidithermotolerans TaxID=2828514 RepID=A0A941IJ70_9ACTN|nr:C40 family peptidase [Actinospica acidithermotolerans]MBR7827547.1 C40 family peptidase [Actinospica acidithermotolerans]